MGKYNIGPTRIIELVQTSDGIKIYDIDNDNVADYLVVPWEEVPEVIELIKKGGNKHE